MPIEESAIFCYNSGFFENFLPEAGERRDDDRHSVLETVSATITPPFSLLHPATPPSRDEGRLAAI
jgi:hypothetical protein